MRFLLTISLLLAISSAQAQGVRMFLQRVPLAGSQYHEADAHWEAIQVGDLLTLTREPDNRHDRNAIRVDWRGHPLGYLPRARNRQVAAAMDAGDRLLARIVRRRTDPDPWQRIEIEVFIEL